MAAFCKPQPTTMLILWRHIYNNFVEAALLTVKTNATPKIQGQRNIYDQIPRANFQHGDRGRADIAGGGLAGFEGDGEAAYIVLQRHWREY
jgi:hypothetical protein